MNIKSKSALYECALTGKGKAKRAKHSSAVEPLQDGEEVTDTTGQKWKLIKLLSQSTTELVYQGENVYNTSGEPQRTQLNRVIQGLIVMVFMSHSNTS